MPVAYSTAYYALVMRGRLEAGQRVLVHAGAGAVGLAAIRICLHRGCEVAHAGFAALTVLLLLLLLLLQRCECVPYLLQTWHAI